MTPLLESYVSRSIQEQIGLANAPEVNLESASNSNALRGRFEDGRVTLTDPELANGVRPDEVTVNLEPFVPDVLGSVAGGRLRGEGPLSGTLRAELSEDEVARIAASGTSGSSTMPVRGVEIEEGYIDVESEVEILGARVPVGLEGELSLQDGELLRFEPSRLEAFGEPLSKRLTQRLIGEAEFTYPVGELPFEGEISGIEMHEDVLVLTGEVEDLSVGEVSEGRWLSGGVLFGIFRTGRRFPRGERFGRAC